MPQPSWVSDRFSISCGHSLNRCSKELFRRRLASSPPSFNPRQETSRTPAVLKGNRGGLRLEPENTASSDISQIQNEFDQQVANLLFASNEVELEAEFAHTRNRATSVRDIYPLAELDRARDQFVENLYAR